MSEIAVRRESKDRIFLVRKAGGGVSYPLPSHAAEEPNLRDALRKLGIRPVWRGRAWFIQLTDMARIPAAVQSTKQIREWLKHYG